MENWISAFGALFSHTGNVKMKCVINYLFEKKLVLKPQAYNFQRVTEVQYLFCFTVEFQCPDTCTLKNLGNSTSAAIGVRLLVVSILIIRTIDTKERDLILILQETSIMKSLVSISKMYWKSQITVRTVGRRRRSECIVSAPRKRDKHRFPTWSDGLHMCEWG